MTDVTINLEKLKEGPAPPLKTPFPHQTAAITALNQTFPPQGKQTRGGLLVLPTGAGKTFTTVKWLGDNLLPKNVKVLWLAHTFHLLDQAYETFYHYARWIPERRSGEDLRATFQRGLIQEEK